MGMDKTERRKRLLVALQRYIVFFLLMAFIITCCMMLFLEHMERDLGMAYTRGDIRKAAILTFGNVVLLSFICTLVDSARRQYMVERPVKRIISAAEKIMDGDFSARIETFGNIYNMDGFNTIIRYFNKMAGELSGMETLRTSFIANVSHEMKTPLAVIQNYGTMLQQPGLADEKRLEQGNYRSVTQAGRFNYKYTET